MKKIKNLIYLAFGILCTLALIILWQNTDDQTDISLNADIFNVNGPGITPTKDIFIPQNYIATPSELGAVEIKANTDYVNVIGLSFTLQWNSTQLSTVETSLTNTVFADRGYLTETNTGVAGELRFIAATGGDGVNLKTNDVISYVYFRVNENIPLDSQIDIKIKDISFVQEDDQNNLIEAFPTIQNGKITVRNESEFRVVDINTISASGVEIEFSDFVSLANIADFTFNPNIVNPQSTIEISGKKIRFDQLNPQIPGNEYRIEVGPNVTGNSTGAISSEHDFVYFTGFPDSSLASSPFYIEKIQAIDLNHFEIIFSKDVNPLSIEHVDFDGDEMANYYYPASLNIIQIYPTSNPKILRAETEPQIIPNLSDSAPQGFDSDILINISNDSEIWNLESMDQDILSVNTYPLIPFEAIESISNSPKIVKATASQADKVHITFNKNIFASSATAGNLSLIYEIKEINNFGKVIGNNLVSPTTTADISTDYKTVTLNNIPTSTGKKYRIVITEGTIKDYTSGERITAYGRTGTFLGQEAFFKPWDFGISAVSVENNSRIIVSFSKELHDNALNPLNFQILSWDGLQRNAVTVTNIVKNNNNIILSTSLQNYDALYFLMVNPSNIRAIDNTPIGAKNTQGFFSYSENAPKIISVSPDIIENNDDVEIVIIGENFSVGSTVRIESEPLLINFLSDKQIIAVVPSDMPIGVYNLIVEAPDGRATSKSNALVIQEPEAQISILSEESYASPYKVSNQSGTTRLWVRVADPLGVADIEKVTADLRLINGEAAALFKTARNDGDSYYDNRDAPNNSPIITDDKRWFYLDVIIPPTVPTSAEPILIPIIAENKSGIKAFGTVKFLITRNLTSGIPPVIENAYASPNPISPGDPNKLSFHVEISDEDGADNIAKVILDLGPINLGIQAMQPIKSLFEDVGSQRKCTRADYNIGPWSECGSNGVQTRNVDLASGVNCVEDSGTKPEREQTCSLRSCATDDWEPGEWSSCYKGEQTRSYKLKSGVNCTGTASKPANETKSCTVSFLNNLKQFLIPRAQASALSGNKIWFELTELELPNSVLSGTYQLPLTVIDTEGEEVKDFITLVVKRNVSGTPHLDLDDIYATPRASAPNDGITPFRLHAKATDDNGPDDIVSVTANLLMLGLPPIALNRGEIEGDGLWFHSNDLIIPRTINPGYRRISFTVTDKAGNFYTEDQFDFYVSDKVVEGDAPIIHANKSYTTPRAVPNDEKTKITFYVFVEEGDADIESVSMNFGTIAKSAQASENEQIQNPPLSLIPIARAENTNTELPPPISTPVNSNNNNTNTSMPSINSLDSSERIMEMRASVREGKKGQWYILPDVVVSKEAMPSVEPYLIPITVSDTNGNFTKGEVSLYITDGTLPKTNTDLPYLQDAVATSFRDVEILFSQPINPTKIKIGAFQVVESNDRSINLPIREIEVSSNGQVANLITNFMNKDTYYTLIADGEMLGLRSPQLTSNQVEFKSFDENDYKGVPFVTAVTAEGTNEVKVRFSQQIKYSTIRKNGANFIIFEKGGGAKYLKIKQLQFGDDGKTILLSTDLQRAGQSYILQVNQITNAIGKTVKQDNKIFVGWTPVIGDSSLFRLADFNNDGKVDFLDFTLFSSVYGKDARDEGQAMDMNNDGKIDFSDFTLFAVNFGKTQDDFSDDSSLQDNANISTDNTDLDINDDDLLLDFSDAS